MNFFTAVENIIADVYNFFWADLFCISLPGGSSIGIPLLVLLLIPAGIFFTIRTKVLPIRLFPEMLRISVEKQTGGKTGALSGLEGMNLPQTAMHYHLGDIGIALMTVFNMIAIIPMSGQAIRSLNDYTALRNQEKAEKKVKLKNR